MKAPLLVLFTFCFVIGLHGASREQVIDRVLACAKDPHISELDNHPKALELPDVVWPSQFRRGSPQGSVWAIVTIGEAGKVEEIRFVDFIHSGFLDESYYALRRVEYERGFVNGSASRFWVDLEILFDFDSDERGIRRWSDSNTSTDLQKTGRKFEPATAHNDG